MSGTPQKSPGGGGGAYENSPRPRDDAPPRCARHSLPASLLQTKTTAKGNQGRWFWICSVRGSDACPFFEWSDSTAPSPHRKRKAGAEDPGATPSPGSAPPSTKVFLTLVAEPTRFAAVSDYNTDLLECFRSLRPEGARWEPAEKHWSFPNGARDALLDRLRRSVPAGGTPYEVQQVPAFVRDLLASHYAQHAPQEEVADRLARLPSAQGKQFSLTHNLKGYQREGLIAMLRQRGRALLADEMGLGKTPQAIALAACYPEDWPLLVICPSTLRETWRRALVDWLPPGFATVHTMKTGADVGPPLLGGASRRCTIVSYDMASSLPASASYGIVVADECHLLKNGDTVRARACLPLLQRAKRALLVSGTPCLQRPAELFTQLVAAMPSAGLSFGRFAARYCAPKPSSLPGVPVDYTGASCLAELNLVLSRTVLIRRTKEDVKDTDALPPKRRSVVSLELDAASLQRVARLKAKLDRLREQGDEVGGRALMSEYYALTGRVKAPAACQHVQELLLRSPDAKLLVFAHHQGVLDALESGPLAAVKYVRVDGTTSHKARSDRVDAFQTDPSVRVALLSVTAAGVGITLTAASTVVFAELVWAPGPLRQAEDRAHRVGQTRQVTVQYLLAPGTLDDAMWPVIEAKLGVAAAAVDGQATRGGAAGDAAADEAAEMWRALGGERRQAQQGEGGSGRNRRERLFDDDEQKQPHAAHGAEVIDLVGAADAPCHTPPPARRSSLQSGGDGSTPAQAIELD